MVSCLNLPPKKTAMRSRLLSLYSMRSWKLRNTKKHLKKHEPEKVVKLALKNYPLPNGGQLPKKPLMLDGLLKKTKLRFTPKCLECSAFEGLKPEIKNIFSLSVNHFR